MNQPVDWTAILPVSYVKYLKRLRALERQFSLLFTSPRQRLSTRLIT
jgi:hypothetical protein